VKILKARYQYGNDESLDGQRAACFLSVASGRM